jgi:hypothetical protein
MDGLILCVAERNGEPMHHQHPDTGTPARPQQPGAWQGHLPITSFALLTLLDRAAAGGNEFSRNERVLFVAAEFWAAVNARELATHVDCEVADPLSDARNAFSVIGAPHLVKILRQCAPRRALSETGRHQGILAVEERLRRVPESVDLLIARFAGRCLCEERRCAEAAAGFP